MFDAKHLSRSSEMTRRRRTTTCLECLGADPGQVKVKAHSKVNKHKVGHRPGSYHSVDFNSYFSRLELDCFRKLSHDRPMPLSSKCTIACVESPPKSCKMI